MLRDLARTDAEIFWRDQGLDVRFERFSTEAFQAIRQTWMPRGRVVDWDWADQFVYRRRKRPTRWDLALWADPDLLALAMGYGSRHGKTILYLEGIERIPGQHPYAPFVVPMVLDATERYARHLESKSVVLIRPHPKLIPKYEAAGYKCSRKTSLKFDAVAGQ
ncbi:MAG: hypothetical protein VB138_13185 [Burkholderia sp.]